jgi:hypothetical protein
MMVMGILALPAFNAASFAAKAVSMEKFHIRNQIPNWTEEKNSYQYFGPKELFNILDGGAPEYIDNGMKEGFFQRLKGPDSATIELYAEDFGSDKNAEKMVAVKQSNYSDAPPPVNSDSSGFIPREVIGGFWACGAAQRYYFEITLMGIRDNAKAKVEIKKYFDYFRKTAEGRNR